MTDPMDNLRQASADVSGVQILSPAALAVWEAFNREEPGVFVDYGDCLAAALRAAADQSCFADVRIGLTSEVITSEVVLVDHILAIANELEGQG